MLTLPLINQRATLTPLEDTQDRMEIMITMLMLQGEISRPDATPEGIETLTIASAAVNSPVEA